jgi:hypothetical protein
MRGVSSLVEFAALVDISAMMKFAAIKGRRP